MENISVRDYLETRWGDNALTTTPEGYLTGRLLVTGAGVFRYIGDDGKIVPRLRSVDDVRESASTLANKPITLTHPAEMVNPENAKGLSVGFCGNDVEFDGLNVFVTCTITDSHAIDAIKRGKVRALSAGYDCYIENDSGTWQGSPYSQRQKNIVYNHVALVQEGRAGDGVRFRVNDAAEFLNFQDKENTMKTITIDSAEYQADEKVVDAYNAVVKRAEDAATALDKMTAEKDAAVAQCSQKDAEIKRLNDEKLDDAAIEKRVNDRIALIAVAEKAGIKDAKDKSDNDIRLEVIKSVFPDISLDGKSPDYVSALFDAAQNAKVEKNPDKSLDGLGSGSVLDGTDEAVAKAKAQYDEAYNNQGKEAE